MNIEDILDRLTHEDLELLSEDCEDFLLHRSIPLHSHSYIRIIQQAFLEGYQFDRFDRIIPKHIKESMTPDRQPETVFTHQELLCLQELLDQQRETWFNWYMEVIDNPKRAPEAKTRYHMYKTLRDKVYHLGGRDTLAPGAYHEQRWWDQKHDY